jgi:signal transduction histidine kinase
VPASVYRGEVMPALHARLIRLRPGPVLFDRALAAVLLVLGELQIWLADPLPHKPGVTAVATLPMYAALAVRRRFPAAAGFFAQGLVALEFGIWGGVEVIPYSIAWGCALYGLTVWTPPRTFAAGVIFVGISNVASAAAAGKFAGAVPFVIIVIAAMLLVRRVVGERERRAQLAERERDVAAREAVVEERARIARELHDAIAHHVSVMVVQAGAERRTLDTNAPTREVLETIERTGRGALTEMRRLLGMLRDEGHDPLTPQPGLADVPALVGQLRDAGLPVRLQVDGDRRELPVGIELSAYRIVQEALTNALKHAGDARATVFVRYGGDSVELEITDDGAGGGRARESEGGHGLVGMRERVALCGGRFQAGRNPAGGFTVRALLPIR